jgi:hypothetical protein
LTPLLRVNTRTVKQKPPEGGLGTCCDDILVHAPDDLHLKSTRTAWPKKSPTLSGIEAPDNYSSGGFKDDDTAQDCIQVTVGGKEITAVFLHDMLRG